MSSQDQKFYIKNWTIGRLNALVKIIGEKNARIILKGESYVTILPKSLHPGEYYLSEVNQTDFTPYKYFADGNDNGVYVMASFAQMILRDISSDDDASFKITFQDKNIHSFTLLQDAMDKEIVNQLPENYVFTSPREFCFHLSNLIDSKVTSLKNTGCSNIFYVKSASDHPDSVVRVDVLWTSSRRWRVAAGDIDDELIVKGSCIFSASPESK